MTTKDYVLIATELGMAMNRYDRKSVGEQVIIDLTYRFADALEKANPNFDRERFISAVVGTGGKHYSGRSDRHYSGRESDRNYRGRDDA